MGSVLGVYTGLARFREQAPHRALEQGAIMIRPARRVLFNADSPGTAAINYGIQGGAASVQMRALRYIDDALHARPELDSFLAQSIHDEVILDAPDDDRADEAAKILVDCMTKALVEMHPESEDMGLAKLTAAAVVGTWAEKP